MKVTITEKIRRAREVRKHLARFIDLQRFGQTPGWADTLPGDNPGYLALNQLYFARSDLNELIRAIKEEEEEEEKEES